MFKDFLDRISDHVSRTAARSALDEAKSALDEWMPVIKVGVFAIVLIFELNHEVSTGSSSNVPQIIINNYLDPNAKKEN